MTISPTIFDHITIKLGIGNFDIFHTSDDFYVDPKTGNIYFVDMMDTSGMAPITLKQWRKLRSDTNFWNYHFIKADRVFPVKIKNNSTKIKN